MSSTADGRTLRGNATRLKILEAARETLLDAGTGGTSTRAVADRAGVPLSLVHYHFGSKQELLAAVLEHENELLLARQRELYAAPGPLAEKWRTACAFLDEDIGSGYVRVLWELWAAGLADEALAERWRSAMGGWRELLESVVADWADELEIAPAADATRHSGADHQHLPRRRSRTPRRRPRGRRPPPRGPRRHRRTHRTNRNTTTSRLAGTHAGEPIKDHLRLHE